MEQNIYPIECSDGIDNNGNGVLDGADQGCVNGWDNNEFALSPVCMDGMTMTVTDGSTKKIPTVLKRLQRVVRTWRCSDFVDNNGDGCRCS